MHREKQKVEENTEEELMLMQTQDLNYVNMRHMTDAKVLAKWTAAYLPSHPIVSNCFFLRRINSPRVLQREH